MSGSQKKGEKLFYIPLFRIAINSLLWSEASMITFSYVLLEVICIFAVFISDLETNGLVFKCGVLRYKTLPGRSCKLLQPSWVCVPVL